MKFVVADCSTFHPISRPHPVLVIISIGPAKTRNNRLSLSGTSRPHDRREQWKRSRGKYRSYIDRRNFYLFSTLCISLSLSPSLSFFCASRTRRKFDSHVDEPRTGPGKNENRERERERKRVCVCVCERERERERARGELTTKRIAIKYLYLYLHFKSRNSAPVPGAVRLLIAEAHQRYHSSCPRYIDYKSSFFFPALLSLETRQPDLGRRNCVSIFDERFLLVSFSISLFPFLFSSRVFFFRTVVYRLVRKLYER